MWCQDFRADEFLQFRIGLHLKSTASACLESRNAGNMVVVF